MQRTILFAKTYGILVVTVLLFVVLALTTEGFFTDRNMRNEQGRPTGRPFADRDVKNLNQFFA